MYESDIRKLASTLNIGNSAYFSCPKCHRLNKFGITSTIEGIVFQCFSASCRLKGKLKTSLSKEAISSILNKKPLEQYEHTFKLPDYLIDGFASESSLKMALKYDLLDAYTNRYFRTAYDPRLNRQVFFHTDLEGNIVGAMGRALSSQVTPKAYIYPNSEKTPWVIGKYPVAVIVEDILSSIKIYNVNYTGIALSGTKLSMDYLPWFKNYTTIIVALDNDASIQSLSLKKLLDMACPDVKICLIKQDFKDLARQETKEIISKCLDKI